MLERLYQDQDCDTMLKLAKPVLVPSIPDAVIRGNNFSMEQVEDSWSLLLSTRHC